ncbi:MAG: hypothetical protein F6K50_00870 [Moorea sp. SIO3I7]|uniref:hypothetical protein n=1 Tax=Moorena sp. SIO3I6 TaxID=2607831 RepID=UPI0013C7702D|nr:hypothetical protein [Moorena sp. SIO3I6]NEN94155.1 hypothetical protein [Moorena sp. SIO3I7]NEP25324.1 hypothetical protein [Moorena sp. SIO3I6]
MAKITTIRPKFSPSPHLPISPSIFGENETALPLLRGVRGDSSCLLPAPCSLLPAPCSLLPAPCSLLPAPCSLLPKTHKFVPHLF